MKAKSLYHQIKEYVSKKIREGEYEQNRPIPNERELAELFNVSRITSKRALDELKSDGIIYRKRGSGSYVSPLMDRRNLAHNKDNVELTDSNQNIIALVMPIDPSTTGMIHTINGANEVLNKNGFFLTIHNTNLDLEKEKEIIQDLIEREVQGIILYPISSIMNVEFIINIIMDDFPIVTIDKYYDNIPLNYVVSDNFDGAYNATQYLIDNGHKRIAYLSSIEVNWCSSVRNRYLGYCKAFKNNGLPLVNEIILNNYSKYMGKPDFDNGYPDHMSNVISYLVKKGVTAIQTAHDSDAIDVQKACMKMDIKVPDQLSILAFNDLDIVKHLDTPLTTIRQDFYMMGKRSAELVLGMLSGNRQEIKSITLPVKLIERQSVIRIYNNDT